MRLALTHQEDGPPSPLRRHRSPAGVSERRRLREDGLVGSPADLGLEMHAKELATNPSTMSPYTRLPCPRAIHLSNHGNAGARGASFDRLRTKVACAARFPPT